MAARLGGFLMNAAIDPWLGAHNRAEFGQGTGSAPAANSTMHSLPLWAMTVFYAFRARRGEA